MKILLFTASFPPPLLGGSVEYVYNIASYLPAQSVVVHTGDARPTQARVFDQTFPQRIVRHRFIGHVIEGARIRKFDRLKEYLLWPLIGFRLIIQERPDVIHLGEYNLAGVAARLAHRLFGIPYVVYTYAEEIPVLSKRPWHNFTFPPLLRNAQAVITVSDYTRRLLIEMGVAPECIFKVLPAIGKEKQIAVSLDQIEQVRRKYHLEKQPILLTVGSLVERKGHATVIEALPKIARLYPDVHYVITGRGPWEETLRRQVQEARLDTRVVFVGWVDDAELACLYKISDVFVMPHRQIPATLDTEGCPTVFLEASAHGKPVVGGNAGGVADAILPERTGFIIDGTDAKMVARTVCRLLGDPQLAHRMGAAGREYVSTLTPERNAAEIWRISQEVLQRRKGKVRG